MVVSCSKMSLLRHIDTSVVKIVAHALTIYILVRLLKLLLLFLPVTMVISLQILAFQVVLGRLSHHYETFIAILMFVICTELLL